MKALIFTGGDFLPPDNFNYEKYDLVICADKGLENIKKVGLKPDAALGDFDSVTSDIDIPIIKYPAEKDVTDTEIAIDYCVEKGADDIMILGGTGGRLDHTLANILLLKRKMDKGVKIKMYDGTNLCFVTDKNVEIEKNDKKYISLFALGESVCGLTLRGVKYSLNKHCLESDSSLGVSNEIVSDRAEIEFESGVLLIILSRDRMVK